MAATRGFFRRTQSFVPFRCQKASISSGWSSGRCGVRSRTLQTSCGPRPRNALHGSLGLNTTIQGIGTVIVRWLADDSR